MPKRNFSGDYTGQYILRPGKDWSLDLWHEAIRRAREEKRTIYEVIYSLLEKWLKGGA